LFSFPIRRDRQSPGCSSRIDEAKLAKRAGARKGAQEKVLPDVNPLSVNEQATTITVNPVPFSLIQPE